MHQIMIIKMQDALQQYLNQNTLSLASKYFYFYPRRQRQLKPFLIKWWFGARLTQKASIYNYMLVLQYIRLGSIWILTSSL